MLRKAKLIALRGGRVLLVRNRKTKRYNFPGGRAYRGETPIRTLRRELGQELPRVRPRNLKRWRNPPKLKRKDTALYFADVSGPLTAGNEIDRAVFARRWRRMKLSRSTRYLLETLDNRGRL